MEEVKIELHDQYAGMVRAAFLRADPEMAHYVVESYFAAAKEKANESIQPDTYLDTLLTDMSANILDAIGAVQVRDLDITTPAMALRLAQVSHQKVANVIDELRGHGLDWS